MTRPTIGGSRIQGAEESEVVSLDEIQKMRGDEIPTSSCVGANPRSSMPLAHSGLGAHSNH
eukprot:8436544-Pyramimonas_sp.AAC.1